MVKTFFIKILVGEEGSGKTTLIYRFYLRSKFNINEFCYELKSENMEIPVDVDGVHYWITLWDTAGQGDYDKIRPLSYFETDLFLLLTPVLETEFLNLEIVKTKWIPELKIHSPDTPFMLVGTKSDLKDDEKMVKNEKVTGVISVEKGEKFAKKNGALGYMECSSKTGDGCTELIHRAIQLKKDFKKEKQEGKCILC